MRVCGDCHIGNLGPIADIDGSIDIRIRDLDQTVIGNRAHDLIRLGLPLATATSRLGPTGRDHGQDARADNGGVRGSARRRRPRPAQPASGVRPGEMRQAVKRTWDHLRKNVSRIRTPRSRWASASGRLPMRKSARSDDFFHRGSAPVGDGTTLPQRRRTRRSGRCCILERAQLPRAAALCGIARGRKSQAKESGLCLIDIKEAVAGGRAASSTTPAQNPLSGPNPLRPLWPNSNAALSVEFGT
jgi:Uncharacterized protein conserved in bacteria (DUF2252)